MTGTEAAQTGDHATPPDTSGLDVEEGHEIPEPPPRCGLPLLPGEDAPVERDMLGMGAPPNTPGSRHSTIGWDREEESPPERAFHKNRFLGAVDNCYQRLVRRKETKAEEGRERSASTSVKFPCPYFNSDSGREHKSDSSCVKEYREFRLLIRHIERVHIKPQIRDTCGLRLGRDIERHKNKSCNGGGDTLVSQVPEIAITLSAMLKRYRAPEQLGSGGIIVYDYAREPEPTCGESDGEGGVGAGTAGGAGAVSQGDDDGRNTSPPPNELSFVLDGRL